MENIVFLTHTHSSYSYLWPILQDYLPNLGIKTYLAHNSTNTDILPNNYDEYIYYHDSVNYARRMSKILSQIGAEYVFLVYDIDIIMHINIEALTTYHNIQKNNNIDRICCATFNGCDQIHENGYALCNLNSPLKTASNHYIPADCSPVIWKRTSFIKMLNLFPYETYASLELTPAVINYHKAHVKCYGIQHTPNMTMQYCRNLNYNTFIGFLHITTKGKFTYPIEIYMDFKRQYEEIVRKYDLSCVSNEDYTEAYRLFKPLQF